MGVAKIKYEAYKIRSLPNKHGDLCFYLLYDLTFSLPLLLRFFNKKIRAFFSAGRFLQVIVYLKIVFQWR